MLRTNRLWNWVLTLATLLPAAGCGWWYHHPLLWRDHGPYLGPGYGGPYSETQGLCGNPCNDGCHHVHPLAACAGCGEIYWGDWKQPWEILSPCDHCGHFVGPHQMYPGEHWYDHAEVDRPYGHLPAEYGDGEFYEEYGPETGVEVFEGPYEAPYEEVSPSYGARLPHHAPAARRTASRRRPPSAPNGRTVARSSSSIPPARPGCRHCQQSGVARAPRHTEVIR